MSTRQFRSPSLRPFSLRPFALPLMALAVLCAKPSKSDAQGTPVPIASTVAGGGVVCANSISTFAPLASNRKQVGDGCPASQSTINAAVALAIDHFNNVAIDDQTNNLIRLIYNGNGNDAMAAAIIAANPQAASLVPQKGYIYTVMGGPQSTPNQSTFYCNEGGTGPIGLNKQLDGCPGAEAFVSSRGLAFDQDGNLFTSNFGGQYTVRVLVVKPNATLTNLIALENPTLSGPPQVGYVYEIAGINVPTGSSTGGDGGLAYKASLNNPRGVWVDSNENVYVAETLAGLIRRIDGTTGLISTVAGYCPNLTACGTSASAGDGSPATSSSVRLNDPYSMTFDSYGNMFIADSGQGTSVNGRIRVVYAGGTLPGISNPVIGNIYTYAGGGAGTTPAQQQNFQFVYGLGFDNNRYLYVNDYRNVTTPGSNHEWRIDPVTGNIVNIAGNGAAAGFTAGAFCNGVSGPVATNSRGDGCPGPEAFLSAPQQTPAFDSYGNFYVAEHNGNVVRYLSFNNSFPATPVGSSTTQTLAFTYPVTTTPLTTNFTLDGGPGTDFSDAGSGSCGLSTATPASMICTVNVKFTPSAGNVREGTISTAATSTLVTEALVGIGSAAQLTIDPATVTSLGSGLKPQGVSVDLLGNVYLSDGNGKQVLRTTLAGGTPTAVFAGLGSPQGTATDSFGNVYVADATNNNVLQRSPAGTVTTVITGLSRPTAMAADVYGDVYVADTGNNRVLRYFAQSGVSSVFTTYPQTLSAPTGLAVDAAGDVYILDTGGQRLLEMPVAGLSQTIALPSGITPSSFAFDHAGNLYVTDTNSQSLLVSTTSGSLRTLQTGLTAPVGLAIDSSGDLFVADSAATSVQALNRTLAANIFATTNINQQSLPVALSLNSIGDLAATLGTPLFTETGNASEFPAVSSGNSCNAALVLAPGVACAESFVFAPTTTGPRSATATFTPAAGNSVAANFSGAAVNLVLTNLTLTQTAPITSSVSYGQSITFNVKLSSTTNTPTPTGTITFVVDGVKQTPQTFASGGNTFTNNLGVGTHVVAAIYSGDSVYSGSNASISLTVAKSSTLTTVSSTQNVSGVSLGALVTPAFTGATKMTGTVTFSIDTVAQAPQPLVNGAANQLVTVADGTHSVTAAYPGDANYAASTSGPLSITVKRAPTTTALVITSSANATTVSLTFTATVTGAGGSPSGTVILTNGTTVLGTLNLSGGSASLTLSTQSPLLSSTNYAFTASYSGDGLFQPSSSTITESGDFAIVTPPVIVGVAQGGQAVQTVSVVPVANYTGLLTATCSNLPANALCRFAPVPLSVGPTANGNLQVEIFAGISPSVGSLGVPARNPLLAALSALLLAMTVMGFRCGGRRLRSTTVVFAALLALVLSSGGCGRQNAASTQDTVLSTPVGTYPITVTLRDTNKLTHSITLTIQVNTP